MAGEVASARTVDILGQRITVLESGRETGGEYMRAHVEIEPGAGTPRHYHLTFSETFDVLEGSLMVECDGRRTVAGPGDRLTAPIGAHHRFANETAGEVVFLLEVRPARRIDDSLWLLAGLAGDGKTTKSWIPRNPLNLAVVFEVTESYTTGLPLWLQRGIFGPLARLARLLGVDRSLARAYLGGA